MLRDFFCNFSAKLFQSLLQGASNWPRYSLGENLNYSRLHFPSSNPKESYRTTQNRLRGDLPTTSSPIFSTNLLHQGRNRLSPMHLRFLHKQGLNFEKLIGYSTEIPLQPRKVSSELKSCRLNDMPRPKGGFWSCTGMEDRVKSTDEDQIWLAGTVFMIIRLKLFTNR